MARPSSTRPLTGSAEQPRLFALEPLPRRDPEVWPRVSATLLTLIIFPISPLCSVLAAVATDNWLYWVGAPTISIPWAWATTRLVRFMLTGQEDWTPPWRMAPPDDPPVQGQLELPTA